MEENDVTNGPVHLDKCVNTRRFDHLLFAYILGIIAISFYALMSHR